MNQQHFMSGIPLPAVVKHGGAHTPSFINSTGGSIAKGALSLLLLFVSLTASALSGNGTSGSPYTIGNVNDWNEFVEKVNQGQNNNVFAKLTADVGTVEKMVGSADKPFNGTFDGQGHTLTVNYAVAEQFVAPFRAISGATIKNLRIAGKIQSTIRYCGGVVGQVKGNNASTIRDCQSSVSMTWLGGYDIAMNWGGLVGLADATTNIENCLFDGALLEPHSASNRGVRNGGFVGNAAKSVTVKNSLMAGRIQSSSYLYGDAKYATFAYGDHATVENCYWVTNGVEYSDRNYNLQGTAISLNDTRLSSGELAYMLQSGQTSETDYWGQTIGRASGNDTLPKLTGNTTDKHVYKASYTISGEVAFTTYANKDQVFPKPELGASASYITVNNTGEVKATKDESIDYSNAFKLKLPTGDHYTVTAKLGEQSLADGAAITGKDALVFYVTPAAGYMLVTDSVMTMRTATSGAFAPYVTPYVLVEKDGYGQIGTKDDWNSFAQHATKGSFMLSANIDGITTMAASADKPFAGIFDGKGHTLTVNYNVIDEEFVAPFRAVSGATIKNLRTAGTIKTSKPYCGGIAGQTTGSKSCFYDCQSSATLSWASTSMDAFKGFGGLLGAANAETDMVNCRFDGSLLDNNNYSSRSRGYSNGGFVGWCTKTVNIKNSLMAGKIESSSAIAANGTDGTFANESKDSTYVKVENSYWVAGNIENDTINFLYQGTKITPNDSIVKVGLLAYTLQAQQDSMHWGQTIGTDALPLATADTAKHVYKAALVYDKKEIAASYANKGKAFVLPALTGYLPLYGNEPAPDSDIVIALNVPDGDGFFDISNKADWNNFTANYKGFGNYRLTADITDSVTTMVGTEPYPFAGTFDGQGHTLTVNITNNTAFTAPFYFVKGATIKNLNVTGKLHQTGNNANTCNHASGLLGHTDGATLEKCVSSVALKFDISGDVHTGGLVGHALSSTINMTDCAFIGSITQPEGGNSSVGGLIAWGEKVFRVHFKNCYVDQTLNGIKEQNNLVRANGWPQSGSTFENCYYTLPAADTRDWDPEPATKVTKEQMRNGYVANLLQNGCTEQVWGQMLTGDSADAHPCITSDTTKRVYKASFMFEGNELAATCANTGQHFPALSTVKKYVSLDPADYTSQEAKQDLKVALNLFDKDADGNWLIKDTTDWNTFATWCTNGNFRLANDIDTITTMAGMTDQAPFKGTFDGQGHTLTVNIVSDQQRVGPFRYINGANIKNLHTAGTISGSASPGMAGGMAGDAIGNVSNFTNCESTVNLIFTATGDATHGGILGRANASVNFNNCVFTGSLTAENGNAVGGLAGWADGRVNVNNCLVAAKVKVPKSNRGDQGNACFGRHWQNYTITNSYVVKYDNVDINQGTYVTAEQLKSGEIAFKLQGKQESQFWGQTIKQDSLPELTADVSKRVVANIYDGDTTRVYDNTFVITEDKGNVANISENENATANVKLVRKFADGWNTLVVPFSINADEVKKAFGDETKVVYFNNNHHNVIELTAANDGSKDIDANTPVLVKPSKAAGEIGDLTFEGKKICLSEDPAVLGSEGINFVGCYDSLYTIQAGEYFIKDTTLWMSEGKTTVKATRGYFTVPEDAVGSKIMLYINGEGSTTTAINALINDENDNHGTAAVYSLSGQKVAASLGEARSRNLPSGVYIVNGKKIVIK